MDNHIQSKKASLPEDWHRADIKAALEKAGWSLRRLSMHHGYCAGMLKRAFQMPYPNAERIIAKAIGVKPEDIWPSRYDHRRPLRGVGGQQCHKAGKAKRAIATKGKDTTHLTDRNVKEAGEA